ncbi:MAG: ATP-dependent 6-phosphofructokinase [Actinobacteria bacterium]|jgi:6-phosphofructokinase 1|nr:ATP-dependent 6-phosphofructokinase [Actinomycetota bacterium]MDP7551192.1 ATP-dependent 6-phosphofructokinase [Acidimicrobiales bacterium]MBT3686486.1 ATP-dependent 6-phosphofructokinase [Actinomycetota bacterium]MBT4036415.1 ATP-dependent 6-phosphofructokinase [Actinomycetota bacterium]MBT4278045.1 ATP-dependent 6-phosphofructokinase [Actinomycetota bacterium]|tara:strand:- start:25715 stop:26743 length:1029 start_codon:yes stop_codon:yes gene_type:complete
MRIGVLTGGGDCPGLNAVIRAVVRRAERGFGDQVVGFLDGWRGVVEDDTVALDVDACRGLLPRGGTVLGTSRLQPFGMQDGVERARGTIERHDLDGLVVVGGEGTLSCARGLHELGFPVVGVPKTIDNDINATEMTFGFETAVEIATEAIDRLHTTAESHDRVMVVEVMGRHVGHIAAWAGMAGGATVTLVPEEPFDVAEVCEVVRRRHERGRFASVLVVAEGARPIEGTMDMPEEEVDVFGHVRLGGIAHLVAAEIGRRTSFDTRVTILGHVQRGGTPTAFDRVLASRFGVAAVDAIHEGGLGMMTSLTAGEIVLVPLADAVAEVKKLDSGLWETAKVFFA